MAPGSVSRLIRWVYSHRVYAPALVFLLSFSILTVSEVNAVEPGAVDQSCIGFRGGNDILRFGPAQIFTPARALLTGFSFYIYSPGGPSFLIGTILKGEPPSSYNISDTRPVIITVNFTVAESWNPLGLPVRPQSPDGYKWVHIVLPDAVNLTQGELYAFEIHSRGSAGAWAGLCSSTYSRGWGYAYGARGTGSSTFGVGNLVFKSFYEEYSPVLVTALNLATRGAVSIVPGVGTWWVIGLLYRRRNQRYMEDWQTTSSTTDRATLEGEKRV